MDNLLNLRLRKLLWSIRHPACWHALLRGVAPSIEHLDMIRPLKFDGIIDVGANRGQFSLLGRILHPKIRICAFEPLDSEATVYRKIFARHRDITLFDVALGRVPGAFDLHISARADSSSLLPIGEQQTALFPSTREVAVKKVSVVTLDSLRKVWGGFSAALLKLDVQGFELNVLQGAESALAHCKYVYAECSHVPLYTGQPLFPEIKAFLESRGYRLLGRANEQKADTVLVQADYLFGR